MNPLKRDLYLNEIEKQFQVHSVCGVLGPRQVGKATLAKQFAENFKPTDVHAFDLENPSDLAQLDNPMLLFSSLMKEGSLIIIDEIQRRPELFPILRVLVDNKPGKILILGSASRDLLRQSSESLAGRIGYIEVAPFSCEETADTESLWIRGGFPRSLLADTIEKSFMWREAYIRTFLEQDIPSLGFNAPAQQVYRFWMMLCHYHGQLFNASEINRSLGISDHMSRKYLDILSGTFMIRVLHPWFENISKRQVKSPKIYFRDSGILHALIGLRDMKQLTNYPRLGAFWEGFALEEILRAYRARQEESFFWATQSGAELDLLLYKNGKRLGFEFKYSDAPKITPSMRIAQEDLKLDHIYVIHPGHGSFPMAEKITAFGLKMFIEFNQATSFV
ncbi:MAG: ATP-binding protein [Candidatus Babeliales bacterium]